MIRETITIINQLGLHARAAAKLVACSEAFQSSIRLARDGREVDGKSIMSVMMLAASCGTDIELIIEGEDENQARDALVTLINDRFGEDQ